jgi:hypothetical protein
MLELSCWSFTNYPGESVFPPLASQANFWGIGQGRAPSDQQSNCQKINSLVSRFTTTWQLGAVWGNGSTYREALQVTAPNSVTSAHANFSFVCQFTVTSINVMVSPSTYDCSQGETTFNFSATITISPGPNGGNITYTWVSSDGGTSAPITISVPAGQTTVTVTATWNLFAGAPAGTYWEAVAVTGPNSIDSNKETFTKNCS